MLDVAERKVGKRHKRRAIGLFGGRLSDGNARDGPGLSRELFVWREANEANLGLIFVLGTSISLI